MSQSKMAARGSVKRKAESDAPRLPSSSSNAVFALKQTQQTYLVVEIIFKDWKLDRCWFPQHCKSLKECVLFLVDFDEERDIVSLAALCLLWNHANLHTKTQRRLRDQIIRVAAYCLGSVYTHNRDRQTFCDEICEAYGSDEIYPVMMDAANLDAMAADLKFYYDENEIYSCSPGSIPPRYRPCFHASLYIKCHKKFILVDYLTALALNLHTLDDTYDIKPIEGYCWDDSTRIKSPVDILVELVKFALSSKKDARSQSLHRCYISTIIASRPENTFDFASKVAKTMSICASNELDDMSYKLIELVDPDYLSDSSEND